jgi:phosphoadenosine phosphosulfate reductase
MNNPTVCDNKHKLMIGVSANMDLRLYEYWVLGRLPNQHMISKAEQALKIIDSAVAEYKLDALFALVSGGDDSLAMSQLAACHPKFAGLIHIDTLTGITDTEAWKTGQPESIATRHTIDYAKRNSFELIIKTPSTRYEQLIVGHGFPNPPAHRFMYRYLKERPLAQAKIQARKIGGKTIGFVTGIRKAESVQRMGYVDATHKNSQGIWIAPLADWSTYEMKTFSHAFEVRNPVSISLGMSGECGCGAYATPDEANVIRHLYPEQFMRIQCWESIVQAAYPMMAIASEHRKWGNKDGKRISEKQLSLPLCTSCIGGQANRELSMVKLNRDLTKAG